MRREQKKDPRLERLYAFLGKMQNIDHREGWTTLWSGIPVAKTDTEAMGYRVRQMKVARNFQETELVIKRTDKDTAKEVIKKLVSAVKRHNMEFTPEKYSLLMPRAYVVGERLIAMSKTNAPEIDEILHDHTQRGIAFFEQMKKTYGVTEQQLKEASSEVFKRTGIKSHNLLLLDFEKGKFVFMPLADIW